MRYLSTGAVPTPAMIDEAVDIVLDGLRRRRRQGDEVRR
jgi:hypothetical protein